MYDWCYSFALAGLTAFALIARVFGSALYVLAGIDTRAGVTTVVIFDVAIEALLRACVLLTMMNCMNRSNTINSNPQVHVHTGTSHYGFRLVTRRVRAQTTTQIMYSCSE